VIVPLDNGVEAVIRPIRPDDKALLAGGLAELSEESAYRRFLTPKKRLTRTELEYLTEVDFRDHVAFVAVRADDPRALLGVGRWIRSTDDPATAEFALVVSDRVQGRRLGTALADALAAAGRMHGIERVVATTLPHNAAAHRIVARITTGMTTTVDGTLHVLHGDLAAPGASQPRTTSSTPAPIGTSA
jgi:acetyltransferase